MTVRKSPAPHPLPKPYSRRRIPAFHPVPCAQRKDGWTPERQAQFIGCLAEMRCVRAAAARVGMGRESAYKLRQRPGAAGFAAAWDAALGKPHKAVDLASAKATQLPPGYRFRKGQLQVVMHRGRFVAIRHKPDNSAILQHLARLDRAVMRGLHEGP